MALARTSPARCPGLQAQHILFIICVMLVARHPRIVAPPPPSLSGKARALCRVRRGNSCGMGVQRDIGGRLRRPWGRRAKAGNR